VTATAGDEGMPEAHPQTQGGDAQHLYVQGQGRRMVYYRLRVFP